MTAAAAPQLPLDVIVLTRDEERDLPACLASVADLGVRLLVLDSGSRDRTLAIARESGAEVTQRPFSGFASQRNAALDLATSRWVLFLDADERLTAAGRAEIAAAIARAERDREPAGFWLPRRNLFFGRALRGGGWWPDYQLRLFRRDLARYDDAREVHEVVVLDGRAERLDEPLIHRNYDTWPEFRGRQRSYASHHARDLWRRGVAPHPWTYGMQPLREFRRRFLTLGGWRDGWLGLALASALAYYELLAHWRLRQLQAAQERRGDTAPLHVAGELLLDLSVIVVSRNTRDLTLRCLASVEQSLATSGLAWEAIVVDNASTDGTVAAVRASNERVRVIEAGGNRGFSAGNNLGIRAARGRALLFLNPDTEVVGAAIQRLLETLQAAPDVGIVGPHLVYPDGQTQPSRRRFPTRLTPFLESTLIQRYWPHNRALDHYYIADRADDRRQEVDWLSGACLLARQAAIVQVGGFDEGFFMYSEELDLCARARAAGWRIVYEPAAMVIHHEGASSAQAVPRRHIDFNTSKVRFYRRRYGVLYGEILRAFLLATYVVQLGQEGAKWLVGHRRPLRRQRIAAYLRVLRSGLRATSTAEGRR